MGRLGVDSPQPLPSLLCMTWRGTSRYACGRMNAYYVNVLYCTVLKLCRPHVKWLMINRYQAPIQPSMSGLQWKFPFLVGVKEFVPSSPAGSKYTSTHQSNQSQGEESKLVPKVWNQPPISKADTGYKRKIYGFALWCGCEGAW